MGAAPSAKTSPAISAAASPCSARRACEEVPERDRGGRVLDPLLRADPHADAPRCPQCWTPPIVPTVAGSDDGRRWPSPCPLGFAPVPVLVSALVLWHVPVAIPSATVSMPLFAALGVATLSTAEGEARTDKRKRACEPSPATQHQLV